jgi:rfaE bifunctional protein kinase chain/domain
MNALEGARLRSLLAELSGRRVVVMGDLVLDEFLIGRIDRISREAPVLILEHERLLRTPGGGGNAVANVAALGGAALPVGWVGDDEGGAALLELLGARGVDTSGIVRVAGHATPTKTRVLAGSSTSVQQQVVRVDRGVRGHLPEEARRRLQDEMRDRLGSAAALLVSDYDHGTFDPSMRRAVAGWAERAALPWTVDSRRHLREFRGMTAATPNLEEAAGALGEAIGDDSAEVARAAGALLEALGAAHVVVTRGSRGMTLASSGQAALHLPAFGSGEVADVTGAGDTVIAVLTLALAAGADIRAAAQLANVAAGLVVLKRGTATVSPAEIELALAGAAGAEDGR